MLLIGGRGIRMGKVPFGFRIQILFGEVLELEMFWVESGKPSGVSVYEIEKRLKFSCAPGSLSKSEIAVRVVFPL